MDTRLLHPFTMMMNGVTGSGKTRLTKNIIDHAQELIYPPPEKIIYHYGIWQDFFDTFRDVEFVKGVPDPKDIDPKQRHLLILDDLLMELDGNVTEFFIRGSHHLNTSVIFIVQNMFAKNKEMRTISLNSQYFILFKNPRDQRQVTELGKQMGKAKLVTEAYEDATSRPYGYLFIDLKQGTPNELRLRSSILPGELTYVYLAK